MAKIDKILKVMKAGKASDLHLSAAIAPRLRQHGDIVPIEGSEPFSPEAIASLIDEIIPPRNKKELEEQWDTDFAYEVADIGRFRVNVFHDRFGTGAVFRTIPTTAPTADELGLPKAVRDFCYLPKGLVVVTGPTGSGKSTTLAAMVDLINKTRRDHIITIEDPVEFIHESQNCLINQREVHSHTKSFANAVRASLREDPDIVLVGEMRDLETLEAAIETAETGHLVFGTLHTNTAATTVERIIDKFPASRQNQIRAMLSDSLKGVIAQTLCKRKDGKGRVAAMEIMVVTSGIASNIRDGKTHQIVSSMQTGKGLGMQLLDDALIKLVQDGAIDATQGYMKSADRDTFAKKMASFGLHVDLLPGMSTKLKQRDKVQQQQIDRCQEILTKSLEGLKTDPDNPDLLNNVAWILATSANPDLRNSDEALRIAEKASRITGMAHPGVLDTLGAAYAGTGKFEKALESARAGLRLAMKLGETELVSALSQRIALYEAGRMVRE